MNIESVKVVSSTTSVVGCTFFLVVVYQYLKQKETSKFSKFQVPLTPVSLSGTDGKGFASCVNRIVKDLMVKVDRLEGILTGLRSQSVRR